MSFTHEQVVCVRHITTDAEQLHEVVELAVDVTAYLSLHQRACSGILTFRGRLRVTD